MKEYSFDPLPGYPVPRLDHIPGMIERHDLYIKDNGQTDIVSICRNYGLPPSAAKMLHEKLYGFIHSILTEATDAGYGPTARAKLTEGIRICYEAADQRNLL